MPVFRSIRKRRAGRLIVILACVAGAAFLWQRHGRVSARADSDTLHVSIAGRDVAVWKPAGPAPAGGYPIVLFSHGYMGCNTQSEFLMRALAQAGYLVLAPNHKDAECGSARGTWYPGKLLAERPQEPFRDAQKWSDATYRDRRDDIESVLDAVLQEHSFQGVPIDSSHVGISGHSLGGYTALGLAGAWPSWRDQRIKAVLALSPHCSPFLLKGDLGNMDIPVMYQGGTADLGETPVVKREGGVYDQSSKPKYYVELDGAGHFAWTDLNKRYQDLIGAYSVAFFDHYLKGQTAPDPLATMMENPLPANVSAVRSATH
jgi:predicted dienelactone hydrolase